MREDMETDLEFMWFIRTLRESGTQYQLHVEQSGGRNRITAITIRNADLVWLANETSRLYSILNDYTTEEEEGETPGGTGNDQERLD